MLEKCKNAATELADLDVINRDTVYTVLEKNDFYSATRIIVTDNCGYIIFDNQQDNSAYAVMPEIASALQCNDVFSWDYHDGSMRSRAAIPIMSYTALTGCIYMMEHDSSQGELMQMLQRSIFVVTLFLELVVVLYSILSALVFSGKVRKILSSMRIIRSGDYTHKVKLNGRDELNLLADEFNELTERLHDSENRRRQFVSDASHELKTPLASIKLLSDSILQNEMDQATIKEFVGDIGNEADRLNRMSSKLLSLSKIESHIDEDCEIISMIPTIERAIRMLTGQAESFNIKVTCNFVHDCPILISEDDLYQIVFNLIENGIKYNRPNGNLEIKIYEENDNAILKVTDSGVGIPDESINNIFDRFYRVDKARSRKSGGSGLGLSIVKNMVERNGGSIQAISKLGEGSTFLVSFPSFYVEEYET